MRILINDKLYITDIKKFIRNNRMNIDYRIKDSENKTLLMYAVFNGDLEIIKEVVENGNQIDEVDNYGRSALHWAAYYNKYDVVVFLVELGAKTDIKDNYSLTARDLAKYEGYQKIYEYLYGL